MVEVTDATFESEVLQASRPTLVDFWAVWCPPCRMIAPVVEEIAQEQTGYLNVAKLDVDNNGQTAARYGVTSIPTLILFKGGQEVARFIGYRPKDALMADIQPHL